MQDRSEGYIKGSRMLELMQATDKNGKPVSFDIAFVRLSDGSIQEYKDCHLTSRHSAGGTVNIRPACLNTPRKIRICSILKFNNKKVYF
jgi:hypothetical protein